MTQREQLPEDAADWRDVSISLPHLAEDSSSSCPCSEDEIFEYIRMESGDLDRADRNRLAFIRSAAVADAQYWLWTYTESDGEQVFIVFGIRSDGSSCLGLANPNGLNAEQFILAEHYDEVYWS